MRELTEKEVLQKIEWAVKEIDKLKRLMSTTYDDTTRQFYKLEMKQYICSKETWQRVLKTMREVDGSK
jgi:multidrug efflux pump subunit AcrB